MRLLTGLILAGHGLASIVLLLICVTLWPPQLGIDLGGGVGGSAMHILGTFPLRGVGMPVLAGSMSAFLTLGSCVLVPCVLLWNENSVRAASEMPE